jgi:hypothetical protein
MGIKYPGMAIRRDGVDSGSVLAGVYASYILFALAMV